jgi:hypothetical protein
MITPLEFMNQYHNLKVKTMTDDPISQICGEITFGVQLKQYFMMNWSKGSDQMLDYALVTQGSKKDIWFKENKSRIITAAMGKGAPEDYILALEWAIYSNKIKSLSQASLQKYCDEHLGIDCSGFVTNYLIACNKKSYSAQTVRNTGATSYYSEHSAINDPSAIRQGDILVWMKNNQVKRNPGHVAIVQSYFAQSMTNGNMRVVEATGATGANPKLLDSMYTVEQIIDKGRRNPVMILVVNRHGKSGSRVSVMRP